jgi:hypothetical protein
MAYLNEKKAAPKRHGQRTPFLKLRDGVSCFFLSFAGLNMNEDGKIKEGQIKSQARFSTSPCGLKQAAPPRRLRTRWRTITFRWMPLPSKCMFARGKCPVEKKRDEII